jgi:hypothetical protein
MSVSFSPSVEKSGQIARQAEEEREPDKVDHSAYLTERSGKIDPQTYKRQRQAKQANDSTANSSTEIAPDN